MTISFPDLGAWFSHCFWPCLRIMALFSAAPVFSEKQPGKKTKVTLTVLLTFAILPSLPESNIPLYSVEGIWTGIQQLVIGVGIGLTMQFAFAAVRVAGEIVGLQMGLSFATFYDPAGGQSLPILSRLLNTLATLLFLTLNGHLLLITLIVRSFDSLPISTDLLCRDGLFMFVQQAGVIFSYGLLLGIPIITLLLIINLSLGLLNRLTPQLSVFVIGFPVTLMAGMLALSVLMFSLTPFFGRVMAMLVEMCDQLLLLFA